MTLADIIREEVMTKLLEKSILGSDLTKINFSIAEFRDILYTSLMEAEIKEVRKKWGR